MEPNHRHGSLSCSLKSMKQIFPGGQVPPFGGERCDNYHSVSHSKVVLGQASDGFVPISSSQIRQPWIVDVIDVDQGADHAQQRPGCSVLVDQGCTKCLCK